MAEGTRRTFRWAPVQTWRRGAPPAPATAPRAVPRPSPTPRPRPPAPAPTAGSPGRPRLGLAVLTCMDARLDPLAALRLAPGDAHVLRNAGGTVTDDALRSLAMSQHLLGTTRVALLQHTDCKALATDSRAFAEDLAARTGRRPPWPVARGASGREDAPTALREAARALAASPVLLPDADVRGFVYDLARGTLREVAL